MAGLDDVFSSLSPSAPTGGGFGDFAKGMGPEMLALLASILQGGGKGGMAPVGQGIMNAMQVHRLRQSDDMAKFKFQQEQQAAAKQGKIDALAPQFFQPAVIPNTNVDDNGNLMPSIPGKSDLPGYANALMGVDPMKAVALQQALAKESPFGKVDAQNFTPESLAQFSQSHNYAHLVPVRKMEPVNLGGSTTFVNPYQVTPGAALPHTQSPDSLASNNLGLARFNFEKQQADKPQIITGPQGDIFSVNPRAGTGAPVTGPDGQPLSKGEKALTQNQGQATLYLGMMQSASQNVDEALRKGFDPSKLENQTALAMVRGDIPWVPKVAQNAAAGAPAQKYMQGAYQWSEAMLRQLTGAAAPDTEVIRNAKTYFPMPGDSKAVIAQKNQQREQMQKYIAVVAGHGASQIPPPPNSDPAGIGAQQPDPLGIR